MGWVLKGWHKSGWKGAAILVVLSLSPLVPLPARNQSRPPLLIATDRLPTFRQIHSFNSCPPGESNPGNTCDGASPIAGLWQDPNTGLLYGATQNGGTAGQGTVFRINVNPRSASYQPLGSFACNPTQPNPTCRQGAQPRGRLMRLRDGMLYGTTYFGGSNTQPQEPGAGTVFRITPLGRPTAVYSFLGCAQRIAGNCDGENPHAGLLLARDGNLYGTTVNGGRGAGTVFQLQNLGIGWLYRQIYVFRSTAADGASPFAELIQASDGHLYGTTYRGGTNNRGTVFRLRQSGNVWTRQILYSFSGGSDGSGPIAGLVEVQGWLYGTTADGLGTIFKLPLNGSTFATLYRFRGTDGAQPRSPLLLASDGYLYGTTYSRGIPGVTDNGTIFKFHPLGQTLVPLYVFRRQDGANPRGPLIQSRIDGHIYGTTENGTGGRFCQDPGGCGKLFRLEVKLPIITNFMPRTGSAGSLVTINGVNLASGLGETTVTFNGVPAEIVFKSSNQLRVRVPEKTTDGAIAITTSNLPHSSTTASLLPFKVQ